MDLEKKLDEAIPTRNMKEKEGLPESEEFDYTRKHAAYREIAKDETDSIVRFISNCLLYTSPSPRDRQKTRMPSSA